VWKRVKKLLRRRRNWTSPPIELSFRGVTWKKLGLVPLDELPIAAFGGQVLLLATYRVQLGVHDLEPLMIEAIAHAAEPFILLGRDVLNGFRLVLDGPRLFLEIGS
jgi:hypothetical protein